MFVFAAEQEKVTGVLNGVAPGSTTQAEFSAALAHATGSLFIDKVAPVPNL
jgi:NAD dependent epimerase/dehydratase family enzyme